MKTEIINDTKTVFGNESEVSYYLERGDNLFSFLEENANKWRRNHTLVLIDDNVAARLFVESYDYEFTKAGECIFFLDPLNEQIIAVRKDDKCENRYIVDNIVIGDSVYIHEPYQAYASSVSISMKLKEKTKQRG